MKRDRRRAASARSRPGRRSQARTSGAQPCACTTISFGVRGSRPRRRASSKPWIRPLRQRAAAGLDEQRVRDEAGFRKPVGHLEGERAQALDGEPVVGPLHAERDGATCDRFAKAQHARIARFLGATLADGDASAQFGEPGAHGRIGVGGMKTSSGQSTARATTARRPARRCRTTRWRDDCDAARCRPAGRQPRARADKASRRRDGAPCGEPDTLPVSSLIHRRPGRSSACASAACSPMGVMRKPRPSTAGQRLVEFADDVAPGVVGQAHRPRHPIGGQERAIAQENGFVSLPTGHSGGESFGDQNVVDVIDRRAGIGTSKRRTAVASTTAPHP